MRILRFSVAVCLSAGFLRAFVFFWREAYSPAEMGLFAVNILASSLNFYALFIIPLAISLFLLQRLWPHFEGFVIAVAATSLLFIPTGYFLNKKVLPGFYAFESLAGNLLVLLIWGAALFSLYKFRTRRMVFIDRAGNLVLVSLLAIAWGGIQLTKFLQPAYLTLWPVSSAPETLQALLDVPLDPGPAKRAGISQPGRNSEAGHILRAYFAAKAVQHRRRLKAQLAAADSLLIVARADSVLLRTFTFGARLYTWEKNIDLRDNPINDIQWSIYFNRLKWFKTLSDGYLLTGEGKYAAFLNAFLKTWFAQAGLPAWKNEADPMWSLFTVGTRLPYWIDAFFVFFNAPELEDDMRWKMLASIQEQANFLCHFRSPRENHLLHETVGVLAAAAYLPEFKMARIWRNLAQHRLESAMRRDVYPDGGYKEASVYYHRLSVQLLQQLTDLARICRLPLSQNYHTRLERMYEFLMYTARPDGTMPQVNDGFFSINIRNLFDWAAKKYSRNDFRFFNTGGRAGSAPLKTSVGLPYTGLYAMRSSWAEEANYLLLDSGRFGSAHGHEDKLSFELYAYGQPFIVEGGTYTYNYDKWHIYFESSFAHNTIIVDGRSQIRAADPAEWTSEPSRKLPNRWISNPAFDYFEASYNSGYGNYKENILRGVTHTRRILYVKPGYWVIWDIVDGTGAHTVEQLFHFAPGTSVRIVDPRRLIISRPGGPALVMQALADRTTPSGVIMGQTKPIQGWISERYGHKTPAPVVSFQAQGHLPASFITVLFAAENSAAADSLVIDRLEITMQSELLEDARAIAMRVRTPAYSDLIMLAPGCVEPKMVRQHRVDAELLLTRKAGDGRRSHFEIADLELAAEAPAISYATKGEQ